MREHGLIVIETTRAHAQSIAAEAINALGINKESEDDPKLIHLSTEVADRGWSDFLMYTSTYDYAPDETRKIVAKAVLSWVAENSPDIYFANVRP
ncbi:hypothetical protein [Laribacter hongkongensis]|uniref:hypothetical protein n=1 Tax=Laribacter hongkongensis TaxID=168471 RepID=UPI0011CAF7F9|nr:hypothetical protein [Laribacter hongkongensis]MCG9040565.1 hypothetical protein [Laribacter hongkongensis]MCG9067153.1 hypothetical protein [Laribacter hongkongensis]MCG9087967.1 hypothetical protein [Laribacter hongkongensis]MCG9110496.1 hypothetical protein [Laribacter hongkongensis]MCG9121414.1 hypothetical protein [Laribacter hongkongensis]